MSSEAVDGLARFFEYLQLCPTAGQIINRFRQCSVVHEGMPPCPHTCEALRLHREKGKTMSVADMRPGEVGRVTQIAGKGAIRQRLLDMGILPDTRLELARLAPAGDALWIRLEGFEVALRKDEAQDIQIETA